MVIRCIYPILFSLSLLRPGLRGEGNDCPRRREVPRPAMVEQC